MNNKRIIKGKVYYQDKETLNKYKEKGDRAYFTSNKGYYIIRPKKRESFFDLSFWIIFIIILVVIWNTYIFDCGMCVADYICNIFGYMKAP